MSTALMQAPPPVAQPAAAPPSPAPSPVAPPVAPSPVAEPAPLDYPAQLARVRHLVVAALMNRGFPHQDADDAAQDMLVTIFRNRPRFADRLANIDEHRSYFVTMALNAYRMRLRSEQRRRRREECHTKLAPEARMPLSGDALDLDGGSGASDVMDLASGAALSGLQREYLSDVLERHLDVEEIAAKSGTSPRAVRAVLKRAARVVHGEHVQAIAA